MHQNTQMHIQIWHVLETHGDSCRFIGYNEFTTRPCKLWTDSYQQNTGDDWWNENCSEERSSHGDIDIGSERKGMMSPCPQVFQLPSEAAIAYRVQVQSLALYLLLIWPASFNFGHPHMNTLFIFATAFAPPIETRSGQSEIDNSSSDVRLVPQMLPGMDVILLPPMLTEMRDVRFCRQLGTYGEISPQFCKLRLWRYDGNTNPISQLRLGHSKTARCFR